MSIVVVAIHTSPFRDFNNTTLNFVFEALSGIAVPFFFIVSGFLLFYRKNPISGIESSICIKSIKGVLRLYCIWTVIYFPLSCIGFIKEDLSLKGAIIVFLRNTFFVGENYLSWPLWYCLALIVAIGMIYILSKLKFNTYTIAITAFILTLFGFWLEELRYNSVSGDLVTLYYKIFQTTRNGVFLGFFCVSIGVLLSEQEKFIKPSVSFMTFIVGFAGSYFSIPLSSVLLAVSLFIVAVRYPMRDRVVSSIVCRKMSVIIYFIHMYIIAILLFLSDIETHSMLIFVLSVLLSVIVSVVILKHSNTVLYRLCFK